MMLSDGFHLANVMGNFILWCCEEANGIAVRLLRSDDTNIGSCGSLLLHGLG